jgi:FAD/FMN-containing dehydrogenase/pimeloyl-ACP methyl ester carboxylesterase
MIDTRQSTARDRLLAGFPVTERRLELAGIHTGVLEGGDGPPAILLHGPGASAVHWLPVMRVLARTRRVIAPDLPGHGLSAADGGALDAERVLAWLEALIEHTCAAPPALVGNTVGGAIAARFAAARGGRIGALVLVGTLGLVPFAPAPAFGAALHEYLAEPSAESHDELWRYCAHDLEAVRARMGERWDWLAADNVDRVRTPATMTALSALMEHFGLPAIPEPELARIAVPTTLVWGREDIATPIEVAEAASARNGWRLHVIEDCADDPPVEQPEALADVLARVLALVPGEQAVATLRTRLDGRLLLPGDGGFADATRLWNGLIEKSPAIVVQPTGADDVVRAVDFAREHDLAVAVRGGGHNIAGSALAAGGLTIDMSRLRSVAVDPVARTATVQPGCLLADVDRATQEHGLATPLGFISEVGAAGLTLGGGLGYLTRRFGWTADNLLEVEIVTADGRVRRAAADEEPDLFWAVRGAGANLGVVTSFTYRLHPVGPGVYGGLIAWPFERAEEILQAYRALTAEAPRELAVWHVMVRAPAAPFVPERWHGERVCVMSVCYSGDLGRVNEALAPIRALGDPVFDLLGERPYTDVQSHLDATEPKGDHYYWRTEYLAELSDELLATCRDLAAECPMPSAQIGLLHLGGALNERATDDGAVGNRDARYGCGVVGCWSPGEPGEEAFPQWVRDAWERIHPFATGGGYVNFQTADESEDRIRAAYGANFERVLAVKQAYDPRNLFRSNRNVRA